MAPAISSSSDVRRPTACQAHGHGRPPSRPAGRLASARRRTRCRGGSRDRRVEHVELVGGEGDAVLDPGEVDLDGLAASDGNPSDRFEVPRVAVPVGARPGPRRHRAVRSASSAPWRRGRPPDRGHRRRDRPPGLDVGQVAGDGVLIRVGCGGHVRHLGRRRLQRPLQPGLQHPCNPFRRDWRRRSAACGPRTQGDEHVPRPEHADRRGEARCPRRARRSATSARSSFGASSSSATGSACTGRSPTAAR